MIEALGILAGLFVLSSFIMKGEIRIRTVNIVGATLFTIYGILIKSPSVTLINGILIIVQIIYIYKAVERKPKKIKEKVEEEDIRIKNYKGEPENLEAFKRALRG